MIETGQDPRRFAEDLLRRLRDLVIVAAVPDAPATGLIDVSEDQGERLVAQAARFGGVELSRAADLVATGLTEMRGATAPRLLLELVCARVLLPGADHSTDGLLARLDRLERRVAISWRPGDRQPAASPPAAAATPPATGALRRPRATEPERASRAGRGRRRRHPVAPPSVREEPAASRSSPPSRRVPRPPQPPRPPRPRRPPPESEPGRRTPALARHRRGDQAAPPGRVDPPDPERPGGLGRRQRAHPRLQQRRRPRLLPQRRLRRDPAPGRDRRGRRRLEDRDHGRPRRAGADAPPPAAPDAGGSGHRAAAPAAAPDPAPAAPAAAARRPRPTSPPDWAARRARPADRPRRRRGGPRGDPADPADRVRADARPTPDRPTAADDDVSHPDDPDADSDGLDTAELLERELGAEIIDEIPHS